jgi:hypothetical protein
MTGDATAARMAVYARRLHLLGMAAACLGLMFIAGMMLRHEPELRFTWLGMLAALALVSCGLGLACFVFRLCAGRPALVIDDEGLLDNATLTSAGMLRWEEIEDVYAYELMGHRMLGIVPVDEQALIGRLPRLKQLVLRTNRAFGLPPFNIPLKPLRVSIEDLLAGIEERQRNARMRRTS